MKYVTTREAGELCDGKPEWLIRRVVDSLDPPVERFGNKRMIPADRLPEIIKAIQDRRAWRERVGKEHADFELRDQTDA